MENEGEGILPVRDNKIREYGMGVSAGTDDTGDAECAYNNTAVIIVDDVPFVVLINAARTYSTAERADFLVRTEFFHEDMKTLFG